MKKYSVPAIMLITGHEVVSILALIVAVAMFLSDIVTVAEKERRF